MMCEWRGVEKGLRREIGMGWGWGEVRGGVVGREGGKVVGGNEMVGGRVEVVGGVR